MTGSSLAATTTLSGEPGASPGPTRRIALAAFVITFGLHAVLVPFQGLTDDDDFYAPAALRYTKWLGDVVTQPSVAFDRTAIDGAFQMNHEHPPLAKVAMGLASRLFADALGWYGSLDGARLGVSFLAALLAAAMVLLLYAPLGAVAAVSAPLLLLSLPRFLFHSEVTTLDVPVAAMVFFVIFAWVRAQTSPRWALLAGLVFGLACLTKLNAPFALLPCALHWLLLERRALSAANGEVRLPQVPTALVSMIVLGPLVFVALWPHLWFDTFARLGAYVAFHLKHYPILLFYRGEIWEEPFAPWHAPFVLALGVMPAPVQALGALGVIRAARALALAWRAGSGTPAAERVRGLVLLQALFAIGIVAFSNVPKYGGEKLFMPFFPLWCVMAADGLTWVSAASAQLWPRARVSLVACALVVLACAPGAIGTAKHFGGYALSYYGEGVGGLRGATAMGLERTYYDIADKPLAEFLDDTVTKGAHGSSVCFEPNPKEYVRTYRWLKRDGVISNAVNVVRDCKDADLVVLTHERRWSTYPRKRETLLTRTVLREKRIDGVPLWTVYAE